MKRLFGAVAALLLAFTLVSPAEGHYAPFRHWHYVQSYLTSQDSLGQWRVTTYYYIRLNGSSPGYTPSVQNTAPMWCNVPYAIAIDVRVTYCNLDALTQYSPDRWRITTYWTVCFWIVCSGHGHTMTLKATGEITERRSW